VRAVAAIFRAGAGLDAEQARGLNVIGIEVAAMNALRPEDQVGERQIIERFGFHSRPIMARLIRCVAGVDRIQRRIHATSLGFQPARLNSPKRYSPQPVKLGPHG
jgi:hypothetical protein